MHHGLRGTSFPLTSPSPALPQVLLLLAREHPAALEDLVRRRLNPLAAELLIRTFDSIPAPAPGVSVEEHDDPSSFFPAFYGAFSGGAAADEAVFAELLALQESLRAECLCSVLGNLTGMPLVIDTAS